MTRQHAAAGDGLLDREEDFAAVRGPCRSLDETVATARAEQKAVDGRVDRPMCTRLAGMRSRNGISCSIASDALLRRSGSMCGRERRQASCGPIRRDAPARDSATRRGLPGSSRKAAASVSPSRALASNSASGRMHAARRRVVRSQIRSRCSRRLFCPLLGSVIPIRIRSCQTDPNGNAATHRIRP